MPADEESAGHIQAAAADRRADSGRRRQDRFAAARGFTKELRDMLVLTRKSQQQIVIGDQIKVTILSVKGTLVRVGIEAPRDVRVLRTEIVGRPARSAAGSEVTTTPAAETNMKSRRGPVRRHTAPRAVATFSEIGREESRGCQPAAKDGPDSAPVAGWTTSMQQPARLGPIFERVQALRLAAR